MWAHLDIYIPIDFQWYKEIFKPLNFDPWNLPLKIQESTRTPIPKVELPWEWEGSFPHTLLHSREHAMWLPGFLLARNHASPYLSHKPETRVVTTKLSKGQIFWSAT